MRTFTAIAALAVLLAGAGWLAADDRAGDLEARVRALEARLPDSGVLEVRGLVVKDEAGHEVLVVDSRQPDAVRLRMLGAEAKTRVLLEVDGNQEARIHLTDREKRPRLALGIFDKDGPYIILDGPAGTEKCMRIEATDRGGVGLKIWGGPGKRNETSHAALCIWEDGTISFGGGLRSAGLAGFHLRYDPDGTSHFEFRDAAEQKVWELPQGE